MNFKITEKLHEINKKHKHNYNQRLFKNSKIRKKLKKQMIWNSNIKFKYDICKNHQIKKFKLCKIKTIHKKYSHLIVYITFNTLNNLQIINQVNIFIYNQSQIKI